MVEIITVDQATMNCNYVIILNVFITIGDIDSKSNCSCLFSDIDECDSSPCMNGATCTDHIDGFNCSCVAGYTGNMCETGMAECRMR